MVMKLYGHPFSSYTWKALIALYEKALPFDFCTIEDAEHKADLAALWPLGKFPVLEDDGRAVIESSIIIEHLDLHHPGAMRLIPAEPEAALAVRFMDRMFDQHVMGPMQAIVAEHLPFIAATPDPMRIDRARAALTTIYGWLDQT